MCTFTPAVPACTDTSGYFHTVFGCTHILLPVYTHAQNSQTVLKSGKASCPRRLANYKNYKITYPKVAFSRHLSTSDNLFSYRLFINYLWLAGGGPWQHLTLCERPPMFLYSIPHASSLYTHSPALRGVAGCTHTLVEQLPGGREPKWHTYKIIMSCETSGVFFSFLNIFCMPNYRITISSTAILNIYIT